MRATELFFVVGFRSQCYWTNSAVILRNVMQEFVPLSSTARMSCIPVSF